ncbi:MAG: exodeoxyribonuclease VII large subunit [Burkholderiaceae bacterium]|jgi:exodeoxyribonuclease VII large subunit
MNSEFLSADAATTPQILSVTDLNRMVGRLLERTFPLLWVAGEISNLTRAGSGHWYFSLKDRDAQVRCVMFRGRNQLLEWSPKEGDHVEARVVVGLYAARGDFQLNVEGLRRAGAGSLFEAFLVLKAKLEKEGLFSAERKRPLPRFVRAIGVVTSPDAAALRDVVATLRRRQPHARIVIYPTPVQGKDAALRIKEALLLAAARAKALSEVDVLLLVRGGGSIEDLWAYNDEALARAISLLEIPIISGIGHETDFTIADFVADLRAATPTAAAELVGPDCVALAERVGASQLALRLGLKRRLQNYEQGLDDLQRRLRSPRQRLAEAGQRLAAATLQLARAQGNLLGRLSSRIRIAFESLRRTRPDGERPLRRLEASTHSLRRSIASRVATAENRFELARTRLELLNPLGLLERGYAIVTDTEGRVVFEAGRLQLNDRLHLRLARGTAIADVVGVDHEKP